jgi:predicted phosphodiesterase
MSGNDTPASPRAARARTIGRIAAGLLAVVVGLALFGQVSAASERIGPVTLGVRLAPALTAPGTSLALPPFGSVRADTHAGPVSVTLSLDAVDIAALEQLASGGTPTAADTAGWIAEVRMLVLGAAARGALVALVTALGVAWALTRSRRVTAVAAVSLVVVLAGSLGVASATFDTSAFEEPVYEGALAYAPGALKLVQGRLADIEGLQRQIRSLASDLAAYYAVPLSYSGGDALAGTYRVLHVSDLHLDPVGMQLTLDLAAAYSAEVVIDTGDISHFGTDQEAALAFAQIGRRPYIFVPGNHDAPSLIEALAGHPSVTVLDGETTTTARGLVVLGIADPAASGPGVEPDAETAAARGRHVAGTVRSRTPDGGWPDIVAVHDPASGEAFAGRVPLVLSGHSHTPSLEVRDGTVFLNAGTTGGVHFTELRADPHIPHGAAVLYLSIAEPGRLVAIDQIEVYGKTRQSAVRRTMFDQTLAE